MDVTLIEAFVILVKMNQSTFGEQFGVYFGFNFKGWIAKICPLSLHLRVSNSNNCDMCKKCYRICNALDIYLPVLCMKI
jgi:hypothetical protein